MSRIATFHRFLDEKHLYSLVEDQELISECLAYTMGYRLDEKLNFLDKVKNSLSKKILGSLSYVKMIDDIINNMEKLEQELIKKDYDYEDELDKIEIKIDEARRGRNAPLIKTLQRQRERKNDEYRAFVNNQKLKIKKGIELLEKAVGKKNRRKEYADLKLADKDYQIAEFRYNYAKKKSSDPKELDKLKLTFDKAREETERLVKEFQSKLGVNQTSVNIENIESKKEKEFINSKKGAPVEERKNYLEIAISEMREAITSELENIMDSLNKSPESTTKSYLKSKGKVLVNLSNNLDAAKNLVELYRGLGKNAKSIENKLNKEGEFTKISNQINSLINDGNDSNSGTTKYITELFRKLDGNKSPSVVKEVIKKIS